jgi:8-oxo-dGTP diphosphatase
MGQLPPIVHQIPQPQGGYRFCPICGQQLGLERTEPNAPERLVCGHCRFIFYLDPKVVAGAIVSIDGGILLLRRGIEPSYGKWVFPGGYVDRGETVEDACVRETREEVNLDVAPERLVNVYSYTGETVIIIVYAVRVVGGELRPGDEALEVKTFRPQEIPWEALAFPSTRQAIEEYLSSLARPGSANNRPFPLR